MELMPKHSIYRRLGIKPSKHSYSYDGRYVFLYQEGYGYAVEVCKLEDPLHRLPGCVVHLNFWEHEEQALDEFQKHDYVWQTGGYE